MVTVSWAAAGSGEVIRNAPAMASSRASTEAGPLYLFLCTVPQHTRVAVGVKSAFHLRSTQLDRNGTISLGRTPHLQKGGCSLDGSGAVGGASRRDCGWAGLPARPLLPSHPPSPS